MQIWENYLSRKHEVILGCEGVEVSVEFIPWTDAGLQDHVMNWGDEGLEDCMREITGIIDWDIMLSDVWAFTEVTINDLYMQSEVRDISALSELINLTD